jgi:riboflavin kinase/FMN adenylyltransferase
VDGVYAGWAWAGEARYPAGISVGVAPSFPDARDVLEAHLIGFSGNLYGSRVLIEFAERIREQRKFDDPAALTAQIRADLEDVVRITG